MHTIVVLIMNSLRLLCIRLMQPFQDYCSLYVVNTLPWSVDAVNAGEEAWWAVLHVICSVSSSATSNSQSLG